MCVHTSQAERYIWIIKHRDTTTSMLLPLCVVGRTGLSRFKLHLDSTLTLEHCLHARHLDRLLCTCMRACKIYSYMPWSRSAIFAERAIGHHFPDFGVWISALTLQYGACVSASAGPKGSQRSLHCRPTKHKTRQCSCPSPYLSVRDSMAAEMERSIVGSFSLMFMLKTRGDCLSIYACFVSVLW